MVYIRKTLENTGFSRVLRLFLKFCKNQITVPSDLRLLDYIPAMICELLNLDSCLYYYLYIIQLCIYHHFQGISLSSLLTISCVPQFFKLGNDSEHLLLDFNFIFSYLGNPFYKVGEYFRTPNFIINSGS